MVVGLGDVGANTRLPERAVGSCGLSPGPPPGPVPHRPCVRPYFGGGRAELDVPGRRETVPSPKVTARWVG